MVEQGRWRLGRRFDLREYVTPEWDESYQPPIFARRRWRKVLPVLRQYCPMLVDPEVQAMRRDYAARDRTTRTEQLLETMIEKGKLEDPNLFSIETVCASSDP